MRGKGRSCGSAQGPELTSGGDAHHTICGNILWKLAFYNSCNIKLPIFMSLGIPMLFDTDKS
jgi:hypothetical protein